VAPLYVFDTPGEGPAKRHLGGLYQGGIDHPNAGRIGGHATRQSGEDDHETDRQCCFHRWPQTSLFMDCFVNDDTAAEMVAV
jgi:hypothetical protein